jgi:hypothetical protein
LIQCEGRELSSALSNTYEIVIFVRFLVTSKNFLSRRAAQKTHQELMKVSKSTQTLWKAEFLGVLWSRGERASWSLSRREYRSKNAKPLVDLQVDRTAASL